MPAMPQFMPQPNLPQMPNFVPQLPIMPPVLPFGLPQELLSQLFIPWRIPQEPRMDMPSAFRPPINKFPTPDPPQECKLLFSFLLKILLV